MVREENWHSETPAESFRNAKSTGTNCWVRPAKIEYERGGPGVDESIARVARLLNAPGYGLSWPSANNYASIDPFWRGSLLTTARGISEILNRYDCMLALGGKTVVSIVYTARDPIPERITFYHISADGDDLCHNDAPKLGIVGNVKATLGSIFNF